MRRNQTKTYNLRKRIVGKNSEGGSTTTFESAVEIEAIIWQASGEQDSKVYGEKLNYMKHMHYSGSEAIAEGDGICINVGAESAPDYVVKSINRDFNPIQIELEAR
jgi:hypothetical protein